MSVIFLLMRWWAHKVSNMSDKPLKEIPGEIFGVFFSNKHGYQYLPWEIILTFSSVYAEMSVWLGIKENVTGSPESLASILWGTESTHARFHSSRAVNTCAYPCCHLAAQPDSYLYGYTERTGPRGFCNQNGVWPLLLSPTHSPPSGFSLTGGAAASMLLPQQTHWLVNFLIV